MAQSKPGQPLILKPEDFEPIDVADFEPATSTPTQSTFMSWLATR